MELSKYNEINEKLKASLKPERYIHTLGVAFTAASLAMRYGCDVDKAELAGLLHDCAKNIPKERQLELCKEGGVELSQVEIDNPALIHAKLGAYVAKKDYGVENEEILDAIRTHTTGCPAMTPLQKIIFTADLIEPNRTNIIPSLDKMRKDSFEDLDRAILFILERQLLYLETTGKVVDPATKETYEYYKEVLEA